MTTVRYPLLPLLLLLAGCATTGAAPTGSPGPGLPAFTREQAEAQARASDQAFSGASVAHDQQAFASLVAPDAVFVSGGGLLAGVAAILNDWAPLLQRGGPTLAWVPDAALAASSGDLILTRGAFTFTPVDGSPSRSGRYVTIWQREPGGQLRVVLDGADAPLPPGSAGAERRPLRQVQSADGRMAAAAGLLLQDGREAGAYLRLEVREGTDWRVLLDVGSWAAGP